MKETVIQLVMLGLAALSCYGYFRRIEKLFSLRAEFAVFVGLSGIGLVMLLAAIAHLLQPAIYALFALGLALTAYSLYRRESLKDFLQPGLLFFLCCCAAFFVLLYGSRLTHVDNFSHWGAILKMIIQRGALPEHESLVYFPAYPTGSSLLIYYFVRITGIRAEWFWAYIQAVYLSSCAMVLFCFAPQRGRKESMPGYAAAALMAIALICGNIDIVDLLVDTLIPMVALAGSAMCIYYRDDLAKKAVPMMICAAFLPMVKNSGYLFSAVLIVFALCICKGRGRLRLPLLLGLSVLAVNRLWGGHVSRAFEGGLGSYHAMSAESLSGGFAEKTGADLAVISRTFLEALLREGRLLWLLLVLAAVLFMICRGGSSTRLRGLALGGLLVWLAWLVGMLGMYFSSMSVDEALRVAEFERYYTSVLVYCAGYFYIVAQLAASESKGGWRSFAVLVMCMTLLWPDFSFLIPQRMRSYYEYDVRCRFDSLVEEYNIPSGLNYLVLAKEENEIIARVMCTYLLQPKTTFVLTEDELESIGDEWRTYDCYIMLDESPEHSAFLENAMAKSEAAGYT